MSPAHSLRARCSLLKFKFSDRIPPRAACSLAGVVNLGRIEPHRGFALVIISPELQEVSRHSVIVERLLDGPAVRIDRQYDPVLEDPDPTRP